MPVKTLTEIVVLIEKDNMMKIPTTVLEHEYLILVELHGADKLEEKDRYEIHLPEDFVVADEYERLKAKYGFKLQKGQPNPVELVWGRSAVALANHLGLPRGNAPKHVLNESEQVIRDPRRVDAGQDGLVSSNSVADKGKLQEPEPTTERRVDPEVKPEGDTPAPTKATKPKAAKPKSTKPKAK